jgi:hypothetical protein
MALALITLASCTPDELPGFARPLPYDAAAWDAGTPSEAGSDAGNDDDAGE